MQKKLLLFDIGNTTMKVGIIYDEKKASYSLRTNTAQTSDDLGLRLLALLAHAGFAGKSFDACVVSSVVPGMNVLLRQAIERFFACPLFFVPENLPIPLENRYLRPNEVGADRLVAGYAARMLCPKSPSLIVVDFGTAVTFDCITGNAYLGGLIFPGPQTALNALAGAAAKLPHISLETSATKPEPEKDTVTSIRHGILFGFASMVDGLCARLGADLEGPVHVIGTGGFAKVLAPLSSGMDEIRPELLLEGLEKIYLCTL